MASFHTVEKVMQQQCQLYLLCIMCNISYIVTFTFVAYINRLILLHIQDNIYRVILLHVQENINICGLYLQGDIATCTGQYLHVCSIFTG
jgi:hypothetical protein